MQGQGGAATGERGPVKEPAGCHWPHSVPTGFPGLRSLSGHGRLVELFKRFDAPCPDQDNAWCQGPGRGPNMTHLLENMRVYSVGRNDTPDFGGRSFGRVRNPEISGFSLLEDVAGLGH